MENILLVEADQIDQSRIIQQLVDERMKDLWIKAFPTAEGAITFITDDTHLLTMAIINLAVPGSDGVIHAAVKKDVPHVLAHGIQNRHTLPDCVVYCPVLDVRTSVILTLLAHGDRTARMAIARISTPPPPKGGTKRPN